ncbi:MAG: helix-turn-helix transcriptional regulator [Candidatus Sedimenticola sp. (ex Thyasira tokunagai)]
MSLGKNLRRMRKDGGLSQDQLSNKTGIRVAHISKLESDSSDPKLSTIYKLMEGLNCSAESLLMDKEKVGIDSILKVTLERLQRLPDPNKRIIIDVIHHYCQSVGATLALTENRTWMKEFVLGPAIENPLPVEDKNE